MIRRRRFLSRRVWPLSKPFPFLRRDLMLAVVMVVAAQHATAQTDTGTSADGAIRLPEVVITATRTRTRADAALASIDVVTAGQIEERDRAFAAEAIRAVPGVDVIEFGSPGRTGFVSIRGAAPDQVLTLLDGIEVNDPTVGQFDFANLTTSGVNRIEVLRGAGGTLYGSQAIGGVVNVLTERATGPPRLEAVAEAGRGPTHREALRFDGTRGPVGLTGVLSYFGSDGFQPVNDEYRNLSTVWRADADLLKAGTLRAIVRYTDTHAGLPNFNVVENRLDADAHDDAWFLLAKGEWEHAVGDALSYRAAAAYVRNDERFIDHTLDEAGENEPVAMGNFATQLIQAEGQADYWWRTLSHTTLGLEFKERSADVEQLEPEDADEGGPALRARSMGPAGEESDEFRANRSNVALYLQEQIQLLDDRLQAIGGMRYDRIDGFGDEVTFSLSSGYLIRVTDTRLRVGYQQGFRAPSFEELFEPTLGDPELEAEESWEIDAGLTQELLGGRVRFTPTYFYRQVDNLIEEVADALPGSVAGVPEELRADNLDARFQGVELSLAAWPVRWLVLDANYTFLNIGSATGALFNRPRHRGSFTATAARTGLLTPADRASAALQLFAVGNRASPDPFSEPIAFEPGRLGGYGRVDLALAYRFGGRLAGLTLTAAVRNMFNRQYDESIGFPASPAWFLIGLRWATTLPGG